MPDIGVVELHLEILANQSKFYQDPATSDVALIIGDKKLFVHRAPLAAQSKFFQELLYGKNNSKSVQREIVLEVPLIAMKLLLTFIYTGGIDLRQHLLPDVAYLMELAHRYGFKSLKKLISRYLCIAVNAENVCVILDVAYLVNSRSLIERCWMIVEMTAEGIFEVDLDLTFTRLMQLLNRTPRKVSEVKLFQFAHKLSEKPKFCTEAEKIIIFSKINFSSMTIKTLFDKVEPTKVLNKEKLFDIIKNASLHEVGPLMTNLPGQFTVMMGNNAEFLFQTGERFATLDEKENCIMVDLKALYTINAIKFLLYFEDIENYCGFYIELSTAKQLWTRVVDYSAGRCSYVQEIYFSESIARYIKIVRVSGKFECNSLEIKHVEQPIKSFGGFLHPDTSFAVHQRAFVNYKNSSTSVYVSDKNLLNGKFENQGTDTSYTKHTLPNGHIVVQFLQPYILSSCRFLLWDFDGRKYSYRIGVASDQDSKFDLISDKSDELLNGWQRIDFAPRPIMRFIIKGSKATVGDELRLVHFEAPAQDQMQTEYGRKKVKLT